VLVTLSHYAGSHFQCTSSLCGGISQATLSQVVQQVSWAICQHKVMHLKMLSEDQMQSMATRIRERFLLRCFALAVDGMMVWFDGMLCNFQANISLSVGLQLLQELLCTQSPACLQ
jgi:hypothetical protein